MPDTSNQIDLKSLFNKILNNWKLILFICIGSMAVGALFYTLSENKYKHKTSVLLRNPLETDRNQLFAQPEHYYQNIRNFADEDHIDEVMAITNSEDFYYDILTKLDLNSIWGDKAHKTLRKNFEVERTSNRDIEFTFVSNDKNLGASIVNTARDIAQNRYSNYFKDLSAGRVNQLQQHSARLNEIVASLTDSILSIKEKYQITSALLPSRDKSNINNSQFSGVDASKAKGLEELQVLVQTKDKLVEDIAETQSLIQQHKLNLQDDNSIQYFHIVQNGHPDIFESIPNVIYLFLGIFLSSLFLGIIIAILKK